jgi:hypothetical protein
LRDTVGEFNAWRTSVPCVPARGDSGVCDYQDFVAVSPLEQDPEFSVLRDIHFRENWAGGWMATTANKKEGEENLLEVSNETNNKLIAGGQFHLHYITMRVVASKINFIESATNDVVFYDKEKPIPVFQNGLPVGHETRYIGFDKNYFFCIGHEFKETKETILWKNRFFPLRSTSKVQISWKSLNYTGSSMVESGEDEFRRWFLDPNMWDHPEYMAYHTQELDGPQRTRTLTPYPGFVTIKMTFSFLLRMLSVGTDLLTTPLSDIDGVRLRLYAGDSLGPWLGEPPEGKVGDPSMSITTEEDGTSLLDAAMGDIKKGDEYTGFCLQVLPAKMHGEVGRFYETKLPPNASYKKYADDWVSERPVQRAEIYLPSWASLRVSISHTLYDYIQQYTFIRKTTDDNGRDEPCIKFSLVYKPRCTYDPL